MRNIFSYPLSQRTPRCIGENPDYLKEYASRPTRPPMSLADRQKQHEAMLARWGHSPDKS